MKKESFTAIVQIFPDGWYYVKVPTPNSDPYLNQIKRGNIAIQAQLGDSSWPTLLWGFGDQTFFITLPAKVRNKEKITINDQIKIEFWLR